MFLGVWWNPATWGQGLLDGIISGLYWILLTFDCIIYSFVSYIYQIFLVLAQGSQIIDDKFVGDLVNRIFLIIGVVMLFIIAYSLLKSMLNPDESIKGKKSPVNIIKDVIISVVLIALLPTIFEFAFEFQSSLLINNTIGKIIVGSAGSGTSDPADTIRQGGYIMSEGVFKAFLHANPEYCDNVSEECRGDISNCDKSSGIGVTESGQECKIITVDDQGTTFGELWDEARDASTFWALARIGPKIVSGEVNYYFLIAPTAGLFVLFVLLRYCLDMALRLVKLAVYEVIAPIPIFARILPGEQGGKVFSNWVKATISTFTEVFIRIAILYFAVFLISTITSSIDNIFGTMINGTARLDILLLAQALIIIGIIMFVRQAPEILKEITGLDAGKYGKSLMKGIGMMTATLGGGVTAAVRTAANADDSTGRLQRGFNAFRAGIGAAGRGIWHGNHAEKFSDMPKLAGTAASNTLAHRARVQAAGGNIKYLNEWRKDRAKDIQDWRTGGFEGKQKTLDTINAIAQNAEAVKTKTEGFVKDKKYMFNFQDTGSNPIDRAYSQGRIHIDDETSLSAVESIIKTLQGTGNADDAKIADELNNDVQVRIKKLGKELSKVASGSTTHDDFNRKFMIQTFDAQGNQKFQIQNEASVEIDEAKSQFDLLQKRLEADPTIADLEHVKAKFQSGLSGLKIEESSDLSKELKRDAAVIQQEITLEQERRKAREKK